MHTHPLRGDAWELRPIALLAKGAVGLLVFGALLFLPAGTLAWREPWLVLIGYAGFALLVVTWLKRHDPELLRARLDWNPAQSGQKPWDAIFMRVTTPIVVAIPIVAGLDRRWGWTFVAWPVEALAFLVGAVGLAILAWTMVENPFLYRVVKVDMEHGQRVITTGPYAIVRHPMYVGVTLMYLALPVAVGSFAGLVPATLSVAAIIVRTHFEDRTLADELPGYRAYAERTRYRLLPGIW